MDPFVGEIKVFPYAAVPQGWAPCNGQLLSIAENRGLYSIIGTTYGGDGKTTFALPDLRGAAPLQAGQGPGLSNRKLGERGGHAAESLTLDELPIHVHVVRVSTTLGTATAPGGKVWAKSGTGKNQKMYATQAGTSPQMNSSAFAVAGGNQPHNNMPPYLALSFCIALEGILPAGR